MHDDGTLLDAGTYLAHCRRLTLTFTTMNPWFDLQSGTWVDGFDEDMQPGNRGDVCTSGLIIDWILTYVSLLPVRPIAFFSTRTKVGGQSAKRITYPRVTHWSQTFVLYSLSQLIHPHWFTLAKTT